MGAAEPTPDPEGDDEVPEPEAELMPIPAVESPHSFSVLYSSSSFKKYWDPLHLL